MSDAPRRPGLRPGRAVVIESGLEPRLDSRPQPKSQYPAHLRRQRQVESICRIPRLVAEFLAEIARHHPDIEAYLNRRFERYSGLNPEILAVVGGDRFPTIPVHRIVGGAR